MTNRISKKESAMKYGKSRKFGIDQMLIALSCVFLAIFVIYPMVMILYNALWNGSSIDFSMLFEVIFQKENLTALKNTVVIAFFVTLFTTIIGVFFAWLLARSDIPAKGIMRWLFTIPFMIPPFLGAMSWDMMLSARGGYINRWLMMTFGLKQAPFNVNSVAGIILVETVYLFPFVYMQVVSALERMDPTLEESARIAGAKQMYVIRKITLPLSVPAISAGSLLVLTTSLANYGIPAMLGFSARVYTLPTMIVERMERANGSFEGIRQATALSIILVIVVFLALLLQNRLLKHGGFDIIKGKSMRPALIKLRGAKYPLLAFSLIFLMIVVLAPLVMIVLVSFVKAYGLSLVPANFTFKNYYQIIFQNSTVAVSAKNSLFLGFAAGFLCLFFGVILSYVIQKIRPRGRTALEIASVLPYSLPGTVLAIGCILAWSGNFFGINLYNTIWIILVAYLARYLSYTLKSCSAALQQVHSSLEEASRACGASHLESLRDVTIPLIKPAMVSSFFLVFLPAMRELTTSVLLYGPKSRTLGVSIYQLRSNGEMATAAALSVLAIGIIMICDRVVKYITRDKKGV